MREGGEQPTSLWMCSVNLHSTQGISCHWILCAIYMGYSVLPTDLPELTTLLSPTLLTTGTSFTLNCTPSAANPPVDTVSIEVDGLPVTSGGSVTVTDIIITIPSVQRSHSGNYSCTAANTRGSAVIHQYLIVADGGEREMDNVLHPCYGSQGESSFYGTQ